MRTIMIPKKSMLQCLRVSLMVGGLGCGVWNSIAGGITCAQETNVAAKEDEKAIALKKLVQQLEADTLAERDAAEKGILELGPSIVPMLPKITASTSAEVEVRLRRLVEKLQSQQTEVVIKPSSVTLKGVMSLSDALQSISKQTGNKLLWDTLPEKQLNLDLEDVSFWDAFDEVLDEGGLDIEPFSETAGALKIRAKQVTSGLRIASGVYVESFRLEPIELTATRSIKDSMQDSLRVKAWISWEPRFRPVYMQFPMKNAELILPDGTKVPPTNPETAPEYSPQGNASQTEVEFFMGLPARDLKSVKGLKGKFIAAIPGPQVQLTFEQLDKPGKKTQKSGNLTVTIDRVRKNGGIYEVITLIKLENASQTMDSFRGWVMNNEAYVLDDKGSRIENVGWQTYKLGGDEVGISYLFDMSKGPDKYRFVYDAPGAVVTKEFTFKLPEMPLP